MNKKLKKQLNAAFYAPEPVKKDAFIKKLRPRELSTMEMLFQQVPYIRKAVWIFAVIILTTAVVGACSMNTNTERIIEALAPLAAAAASLEIHRSYRYKMTEFEMATRFSMKSVFYARMLIIGLAYAAVFCIIAPIISVRFGISVTLLSLRILIPYLVTTSICLHLERTKIGRTNTHLSAAVAAIIAIGIMWISSYDLESLTNLMAQWGLVILIMLVILGFYLATQFISIPKSIRLLSQSVAMLPSELINLFTLYDHRLVSIFGQYHTMFSVAPIIYLLISVILCISACGSYNHPF